MTGPGRPTLQAGDTVVFREREWEVVGLGSAESGAPVQCWLRDDVGAVLNFCVADVLASDDFQVAGGEASRLRAPQLGLLATVPEQEEEDAYTWERHLREVEWGVPSPGAHGPVRKCYDPSATTLGQRMAAKAEQLQGLGFQASVATIRRMRDRYRQGGVWGLVRKKRPSSATGRANADLVKAIQKVLEEEEFRSRSTGWKTRLRKQVKWLVAEEEDRGGPHVVVPPESTFNKLVAALEDKRLRGKNMAQRRWWSARPQPPFTPTVILRPGEWVMLDTTPLDVLIVLEDGSTARPELTIAFDVATRYVCGTVLRVEGTALVDALVLLAQAVTPPRMRPGWKEALRLQHSVLPYERLVCLDERFADAATRAVIMPETIVVDQGKVFVSDGFLAACESLGISVQPAPPGNGPAKGHVERAFGSLGSQFCQYLAGATGSHVGERGRHVEEEARHTLPELQAALDEFLTVGYHNRKHDGLRHPLMPKRALSPNEMWAALVAVTGYVPVPLTAQDYVELLPVRWHPITDHGIRFDYRTYDGPCLNGFRGEDSGMAAKDGQWEVHHNPYDPTRIWVRLPDGFTEVPWIHAGEVSLPFTRYTWQHIRRVVERTSTYEEHEKELARALDDLLRRVARRDGSASRREKRVVATTRATQPLAAVPPAAVDVLQSPTLSFGLTGVFAAPDEDDETVPDEDDDFLGTDEDWDDDTPDTLTGPAGSSIRNDATTEDDLWLQ